MPVHVPCWLCVVWSAIPAVGPAVLKHLGDAEGDCHSGDANSPLKAKAKGGTHGAIVLPKGGGFPWGEHHSNSLFKKATKKTNLAANLIGQTPTSGWWGCCIDVGAISVEEGGMGQLCSSGTSTAEDTMQGGGVMVSKTAPTSHWVIFMKLWWKTWHFVALYCMFFSLDVDVE